MWSYMARSPSHESAKGKRSSELLLAAVIAASHPHGLLPPAGLKCQWWHFKRTGVLGCMSDGSHTRCSFDLHLGLLAALLSSMPALIGPAMRWGTSPRARIVAPRLWIGGIEAGARAQFAGHLLVVRDDPNRPQSELADVELVRSQRSEPDVDALHLQAQLGSAPRQPLLQRRRPTRTQV